MVGLVAVDLPLSFALVVIWQGGRGGELRAHAHRGKGGCSERKGAWAEGGVIWVGVGGSCEQHVGRRRYDFRERREGHVGVRGTYEPRCWRLMIHAAFRCFVVCFLARAASRAARMREGEGVTVS